MAEDDLSQANRESDTAPFDFDEDAIASLLDTFVETQTGSQAKRSRRPSDPSDAGAQAAHRTIFQHTSRHEELPLVGDTPETKVRRIDLLQALAARAVGSARARLLTSAAELHEQLGDDDAAAQDYERALGADARDVVVLRALRRHAMRRQDWKVAADMLEREAGLELSAAERASALKLLALVQLSMLGDPAAAAQAAAHAAELREGDFVARILGASARLARGDATGAAESLMAAAERWPNAEAQAVMLLHAAELMESEGVLEPAGRAYRRVLELEPAMLDAHFGAIRAARGLGQTEAAIDSLRDAAERASKDVAAALRRTAATLIRGIGREADAVLLLERAQDTASLWTLAETAALAGDATKAIEALGACVSSQTPEIAAVSSARRARLQAERGDSVDLESAARDAQPLPGLDDYLQACKRLVATDDEEGSQIRRLLETISGDTASLSSSRARADDTADRADAASFVASLERELEQAPPDLVAGAALAIAEAADMTGVTERRTVLLRAEALAPSDPMIRRALLFEDDDAARCARRWIDEGESANGVRSAFAFTMAARLASADDEAAVRACEAALGRQVDYWPALWHLEDHLGTPEARAGAAAKQASLAPAERMAGLLRAAIWTSSSDVRAAYAREALDPSAPDPLLVEELFEATGIGTEAAGGLMASVAPHLGLVLYLERAAASYRLAGLPDRAAKVLREASAALPDDAALRVQRKDAELQAGEFARLADSTMRRAREAANQSEQLGALCAMAEVDRLARRDMQSARLSLQSIAEMRPDHIPTARALEWDALRENDVERIRSSARRVAGALPSAPADRLARHRLIVELLQSDPDLLQVDIDRVLRGIEDGLEADPGLARKVLGAAYVRGDSELCTRALAALDASVDDDLERSALALDAALVLERSGAIGDALGALNRAKSHPLAREEEARLLRSAARMQEAAAAFQDAASRAKDPRRAAALWREAARVFEEALGDQQSAVDAWVSAATCDITYLDVYRRLAELYRSMGMLDALGALTEARIDAGADTPTLVALLLEKAQQQRAEGDMEGVIETLHECLELDPQHFAALRELVDTQRATKDWQGAAEALIRIARLKRTTDEQVWAFCQLAEVYDVHLQDLPRAEASLRKVTKLAPAHVATLDRLASVMSRQHEPVEAAKLLVDLVRRATSDAQRRDYRMRLAQEVEAAGDARQAELMLENLRTEDPTDPDVIFGLADYYRRQNASPAEAMHLHRATSDLRTEIDARPDDEILWTTLVRVLDRRLGAGPASCAASAAIAIGHPASLFEGAVTGRGEALGDPSVPFSNSVDNIVAPHGLPTTIRRLFALCEDAFEKVLPFDESAWRLRKPSGPHRGLIEETGAVAERLGISEPRLKVTYVAPVACMPIFSHPPTIVVGANLPEMTTPSERVFLFARALKVASNRLAPALRARPEDLDTALLALLQNHEANRAQPDPRQLHDLRKKLLKAVPRRWRDEVESLALELRGDPGFSTRAVPFAIAQLGNHAALTLTGDVPSAVSALLKIAGRDLPAGDARQLIGIRETPEAWALVRFAISDAHFEARTKAGVDP
jgi:hypothetical protein